MASKIMIFGYRFWSKFSLSIAMDKIHMVCRGLLKKRLCKTCNKISRITEINATFYFSNYKSPEIILKHSIAMQPAKFCNLHLYHVVDRGLEIFLRSFVQLFAFILQ